MKYPVKYVLCDVCNGITHNCKEVKDDSKLTWIERFIVNLMKLTDRPVRFRNTKGKILAYDYGRKGYVSLDKLEVDQTYTEFLFGLFAQGTNRSINSRIREYKKGAIVITPPITREGVILKYNGKIVSRGCPTTLNHMEVKLLKAHFNLQGRKYGLVI